jgi:hypothetical protein
MITINQILYILIFISIFFYLLKINRLLYYYLFTCLILVGFVVSKNFSISIATSGILTALIYVFLDKQIPLRFKKSTLRSITNTEHYANSSKRNVKKSSKNTKQEDFDDDKSQDEDEEEFFESQVKPNKKPKKKAEPQKVDSDDSEQEDFEPINNKLNAKESFQTIIKSLKSTEISSLNNDTKALIDTQKQLMETLQSMGPALKEGKTILDTFKNYFNDSNLDKLSM